MPPLRSRTVTHGRNMAGARALLRAAGVAREDFGKPIVAVANSYTQFVPGHTHLKPVGEIVSDAVQAAGGIPREFNTIAVDDGIAMGHGGMLYSLPSRDLIADSVEYMVNAHCADALICISNCDKITPGMLNAALRLNIPTVFVSGGPMEGGTAVLVDGTVRTRVNLITRDRRRRPPTRSPTRTSRSSRRPPARPAARARGMFTANSMNCLTEALGLALPGNGSILATHTARKELYEAAGRTVVDIALRYYDDDDESVLPRSIATRAAFENAITLDVAMGGSTNTVLHVLAAAQEAELDFTMQRHRRDLAARALPDQGRAERHLPDGGRPSRRRHPGDPRRAAGAAACSTRTSHGPRAVGRQRGSASGTSAAPSPSERALEMFHAAPGCQRSATAFSQSERWETLDTDAADGCIHDIEHAHSKDGGLAILYGNIADARLRRQDRRRRRVDPHLQRPGGRGRVPGRRRRRDPHAARSTRATSSSSATRARAAARACRRCSTRPPTSRAAASARPAR